MPIGRGNGYSQLPARYCPAISQLLKNRCQKLGVPILDAPEGRRDDFVDPYFKHAKNDESHPPPTGFSYQSLLSTLQANGIGWLAWSWGPDACEERRISADADFSGLTRYGDDVVNNPIYGLKASSVRVPAPPLGV